MCKLSFKTRTSLLLLRYALHRNTSRSVLSVYTEFSGNQNVLLSDQFSCVDIDKILYSRSPVIRLKLILIDLAYLNFAQNRLANHYSTECSNIIVNIKQTLFIVYGDCRTETFLTRPSSQQWLSNFILNRFATAT